MTSEQLQKYSIAAEIIGGIAVVVTLIVLIFEVRDNTSALRIQEVKSARESWQAILDYNIENSDVYIKSLFEPENLTREELLEIATVMTSERQLLRTVYDSYLSGIISQEDWAIWRSSAPVMFGHPLGRIWWEDDKVSLISMGLGAFVSEIDNALDASGGASDVEWLTRLESLVNSQLK